VTIISDQAIMASSNSASSHFHSYDDALPYSKISTSSPYTYRSETKLDIQASTHSSLGLSQLIFVLLSSRKLNCWFRIVAQG
jgi:hypothetical protein